MPLLRSPDDPSVTAASPEALAGCYPPRAASGLDPTDRAGFCRRIEAFRRHHAARPDAQRNGSLQILDIEQIRLRFGRRWASVREKAYQIIEGTLHKRLGAHDLYVLVDADHYFVFLTGAPRAEAEVHGRLIAAEITGRLCGTMPGGAAVRLKTIQFDFVQGFTGVTGLTQLRERVESVGRTIDVAELKLIQDNIDRLQLLYHPIINPKKRLISAYQGVALRRGPDGPGLPAETLCPDSVNGVFDAELDKWTIRQAGAALETTSHKHTRRPAGLLLPLHFETLASMRLRQPFLAECRRLPETAGQRLVLEVHGLPPALVQSRVRELMGYIRPFCAHIVVRLMADAIHAAHLESTGVDGISLDAAPLAAEAEATHRTLAELTATARSAGMRGLILNARDLAIGQSALKVGADYISGDAFMRPLHSPGEAVSLARPEPPGDTAPG